MDHRPHILVTDDEAAIRHVVASRLRDAAYDVLEAADGEEALELASNSHLDLVITDLQMPWMSGLELAMLLKARPHTARIPVLMLTARGHLLSDDELAQTNIRQVIVKPFSARLLVATVASLLAGHSRQDAGAIAA